jgi:hypothetical protein
LYLAYQLVNVLYRYRIVGLFACPAKVAGARHPQGTVPAGACLFRVIECTALAASAAIVSKDGFRCAPKRA